MSTAVQVAAEPLGVMTALAALAATRLLEMKRLETTAETVAMQECGTKPIQRTQDLAATVVAVEAVRRCAALTGVSNIPTKVL